MAAKPKVPILFETTFEQMAQNRHDVDKWHDGEPSLVYVADNKGNKDGKHTPIPTKAVYYHARHDATDTMHPIWLAVTRGDKYWVMFTYKEPRPRTWTPIDAATLKEAKAVALVMDRMR